MEDERAEPEVEAPVSSSDTQPAEGGAEPVVPGDGSATPSEPQGPVAEAEVKPGPERLGAPPVSRLQSWSRSSAMGMVLSSVAFGLREALENPREEAGIIMESAGEPPTDLPVEAELGHLVPAKSVVKVRPWLLDGGSPQSSARKGSDDDAERPAGPQARGDEPGVSDRRTGS